MRACFFVKKFVLIKRPRLMLCGSKSDVMSELRTSSFSLKRVLSQWIELIDESVIISDSQNTVSRKSSVA